MHPSAISGLIILEGSDGTGKTTLANFLVEKYGATYLHLTYRFKTRMFQYHLSQLRKAIELSKTKLVVIDRLWMSEELYAQAYRSGTVWGHGGRILDRIIQRHGGMYIVCQPTSPDEHVDTFEKLKSEREEMYTDTKDVTKLYWDLFFGINTYNKTRKDCYSSQLTNNNGLVFRRDILYYSISVHGHRLNEFCFNLITALIARKQSLIDSKFDLPEDCLAGNASNPDFIFYFGGLHKFRRKSNYPLSYLNPLCTFVNTAMHLIELDESKALLVDTTNLSNIELCFIFIHFKAKHIFCSDTSLLNSFKGKGIISVTDIHQAAVSLTPEEYSEQLKGAMYERLA